VKVLYGKAVNLVVSASRDRTIRFWNTNSDTPVQKLVGHELVVTAIDFNPGMSLCERSITIFKYLSCDRKLGFG
jgi:WD40 repeat protein